MDKVKKKLGDRKDARRIRDIDGLFQISIDLKPNRCDSDVYINQKLDVTNLVKYMDKKKKDGSDISYFHIFLTAFAKVIYNRSKLNYFVANRHLYEHNEIIISFVAKVSFDDKSEEVMILVPIGEDDNLYSISKYIKEKIDALRNNRSKKEGANSAIDVIGKFPNVLRVPIVGIFKWCDKKGILPSAFIKDNIYYSSMMVSNLGSIKCGAIYHNINTFGTCSSLATIGEIKEEKMFIDGKDVIRNVCDVGINLDERIADGYYLVKSVKLLQYILDNPEMLEDSVSKKINLEEIR